MTKATSQAAQKAIYQTAQKATYVFNGVAVAHSPLATCGPSLSQKSGKGARLIPTLFNASGEYMYMPGAGLRSKLRMAATALTREAIMAREMRKLSLLDAQLLRIGGVKQKGTEAVMDTVEYLEMVRKNPLLGVFGAATPWVTGKVMIGHLICQEFNQAGRFEPMLVDGVRTDTIQRDPEMVQFLDDNAMTLYAQSIAKVKAYAKVKSDIKALISKGAAEKDPVLKKRYFADAKEMEAKTKDDKTVSEKQPLAGYMAIPPHAKMDSKIRLLNASEIELGCLLASMQRFALEPLLGAHVAHGGGEVGIKWEIKIAGQGVIGTAEITPFEGLTIVDATPQKPLANALAAFEKYMQEGDLEPWAVELILKEVKEEGEADE